jgi:HlyD family type I secretion membrane fusion protein
MNAFDQSVILKRSPIFSRAIVWGIVGVTTFTVLWAAIAKVEETIPAMGQLEPTGSVREVQVPLNGVVRDVLVKEGDRVKQGDLLLRLDPTAAKAQLASLQKVRTALQRENQFYQAEISGELVTSALLPGTEGTNLPMDLAALTRSRAALVAENRLYRAQLTGRTVTSLSPEEQLRLQSSQDELSSRTAAVALEVDQLKRQLAQTQIQLSNSKGILEINQKILNDLGPLMKEGGIARVQYLRQQQEVSTRQAEVEQFTQEAERLKLAIAQSQQRLQNTRSASTQDVLVKISDNEKRIAEIDGQLKKAIVDNEKRIAEIDSQISQTEVTLQYQDLHAPVSGAIFDLKARTPGFVATSTDPVLKIVPDKTLNAKVFITNKDIGFVKPNMPVDIRIDSFPFSEFGDIKGTLVSIGSDALPPTEIRPFYSFPAEIRLDRQFVLVRDKEMPLQSGMSITANIKVRDRAVLNIFFDSFMQKVDTLKNVR